MQPTSHLRDLIKYIPLALSTLKDIARSAHVPFLVSTTALCAMILELVEVRFL
jgi:hypothetical protein